MAVFFKLWVVTQYWVTARKALGHLAVVSTADGDIQIPVGGAAQLKQASVYLFRHCAAPQRRPAAGSSSRQGSHGALHAAPTPSTGSVLPLARNQPVVADGEGGIGACG